MMWVCGGGWVILYSAGALSTAHTGVTMHPSLCIRATIYAQEDFCQGLQCTCEVHKLKYKSFNETPLRYF